MDRKRIAIIVPLFVLLGLGGAYVYYQVKTTPTTFSPEQEASFTPSESLNEYTDGSGFSFNYPDNVEVRRNENSDEAVYAYLTLVFPQVDGGVTLTVADTKLLSIDEWVKQNAKGESKTQDIKLSDISGREIITDEGLLTGVLDQGILFTIEVDFGDKKDFWQSVYETFTKTFAFSAPEKESDVSGLGAESDVVFEDEEVIE